MSWIWTEHSFPLEEELTARWNLLREKSGQPHIQTSLWWLDCWVRRFAPEQVRMWSLALDGVTHAMVPVWQRRERDPHCPAFHRVWTLVGDGFGDELSLLVTPADQDAVHQVARWLDRQGRRAHEARLCPFISETPSFPLLEELARYGWEISRVEGNPQLDLRPGWARLEQNVGKNLRHDVAKKKRRLGEVGVEPELGLETACTPALLMELVELAGRRMAVEGHKSSFLDPDRYAFIVEVGRRAEAHGEFACFTLRDKGRLLAYRFGFFHRGTFFDWITSYDPEFFPYSIGKLMLWDLIERLCAMGVTRLDFMAGEEEYKLKWGPEVRGMWLCRRRRSGWVNTLRAGVRTASRIKNRWTQ
jgi:CelD/BcsL family acetyltransferase involved in cellulose biosynthesis